MKNPFKFKPAKSIEVRTVDADALTPEELLRVLSKSFVFLRPRQ
jgi:hypothetical protein